jgi:hypothetical protein
MKWVMTKRTLTAATTMITTVPTVAENASFDNHQVLAQVASMSTIHTRVAEFFDRKLTRYLIKYSNGKRMIHSRSTMCQKDAPLSNPTR